MANNVKVKCITNGKTFKTISEAARYAGADDWSMSLKMSVHGVFVDKLGREYIREKPMATKNIYYAGATPTVHSHKPYKKKKPFDLFDNMPPLSTTDDIIKPKKTCPDIIKQACCEKIKQTLKDKGVWDEIIQMLDYLGIDKFEIRK